MSFEPVIGLEVHLQVKTKSKMFCRCKAQYFGEAPNVNICPVCFGLPGALPMPNEKAIEKAIRMALALNCEVTDKTKFDRKNYYYPDLPKGFQISQLDKPIGENGFVEIEVDGDSRRVRLQRLHLEEDTAKSVHATSDETLIDYNKSGVPLIETVTEPDFSSTEEVIAFAKRLRQIARYTDTSDAEMQKGQMRFELNISVRESGETKLPDYKVEVKNIGSISVLEKVLEKEIARQIELIKNNEEIPTQTRGLKNMSGETVFQRRKESSDDYRYFPEPDIAPINIVEMQISEIKTAMPELPVERRNRYLEMGLENEQADIFVESRARGDYFDEVTIKSKKSNLSVGEQALVRLLTNWINTELAGQIEKRKMEFSDVPVTPEDMLYLIDMIEQKKITGAVAKKVIDIIFDSRTTPRPAYRSGRRGPTEDKNTSARSAREIIDEENLVQINDGDEVEKFIEQVISENPKVVEDTKKNPNAIKFLVGQVMRLSKGRVNPKVAEERIKEKIY